MVHVFYKCISIITFFTAFMFSACQAKNLQETDLVSIMVAKVKSNNIPVFNTREVFDSTHNKLGEVYSSNVPLEWSVIGGFQVLHVSYDNLEKIETLGQKNENSLFKAMSNKKILDKKSKSESVGLTPRFLRSFLKNSCLVNPKLEGDFTSRFTMNSGKSITRKEECRMFAWASAAHGIEFVADPQNADTIIIREVSSVQ
ncbi:MAG: hypothetical protein AAGB12_16825 [Pseudomonadota bacterium]